MFVDISGQYVRSVIQVVSSPRKAQYKTRNIPQEYKPKISHILTSTSSTFFKKASYSPSIETKFGKGGPSDLNSDLENGLLSTLQFERNNEAH
jgi:hypothetical protein